MLFLVLSFSDKMIPVTLVFMLYVSVPVAKGKMKERETHNV